MKWRVLAFDDCGSSITFNIETSLLHDQSHYNIDLMIL